MNSYPNPVDQILYIDIINNNLSLEKTSSADDNSFDIRLYNIQGVQVKNAKSNGEQISIDVSNLIDGNYFLHIYKSGQKNPVIQKVIIQHSLISK